MQPPVTITVGSISPVKSGKMSKPSDQPSIESPRIGMDQEPISSSCGLDRPGLGSPGVQWPVERPKRVEKVFMRREANKNYTSLKGPKEVLMSQA